MTPTARHVDKGVDPSVCPLVLPVLQGSAVPPRPTTHTLVLPQGLSRRSTRSRPVPTRVGRVSAMARSTTAPAALRI